MNPYHYPMRAMTLDEETGMSHRVIIALYREKTFGREGYPPPTLREHQVKTEKARLAERIRKVTP